MITPGFEEHYTGVLTTEIELINGRLVSGSVADYNAYVAQVGRRAGLMQALETYKELANKMKGDA